MMRLEKLISEKNTHSIGIAEFRNKNGLGKDELISLAQNRDETLLVMQLLDASKIVDFNHLLFASQNGMEDMQKQEPLMLRL